MLQNFGKVRRSVAEALAVKEYEKYDANRRAIEDADVDELAAGIKKLKQ